MVDSSHRKHASSLKYGDSCGAQNTDERTALNMATAAVLRTPMRELR